jgi:hypothetical protein
MFGLYCKRLKHVWSLLQKVEACLVCVVEDKACLVSLFIDEACLTYSSRCRSMFALSFLPCQVVVGEGRGGGKGGEAI